MKNRIDKDTEITVVNNTYGSLIYNYRQTILGLDQHGDEDYLTFGELRTMASSKYKSLLQKLSLLITEVDSDEFTVKDVIDQLKLTKYYKNAWKLCDEDEDLGSDTFEEFVENCSSHELSERLKDENISGILIDAAANLYRDKELTDYDKMHVIGKALGVATDDVNSYFSDMNPKTSE